MDDVQPEPRFRFTLRELFIVTAVICGLLALIVPFIRASRDAARRSQCQNNLISIALGFHNYHDTHRTLPASRYVADDGTLLHSWRPGLVSYVEANSFHAIYSLKEPWDGPANSRIINGQPITYREKFGAVVTEVIRAPTIYQCPEATPPKKDNTSYVVVTGPRTLFPADNVSVQFAQVVDGTSVTLLVGEMNPPAIHWLQPRDLELAKLPLQMNARSRPCLSSNHPKVVNAAMADGSVHALDAATPANQLNSLILIDDVSPAGPLKD